MFKNFNHMLVGYYPACTDKGITITCSSLLSFIFCVYNYMIRIFIKAKQNEVPSKTDTKRFPDPPGI